MRARPLALVALALLAAPASTAARVEIHAHRGGPLENGRPVAPEDSMSAFTRAAERWRPDYLELDVKYTRDRIPIVIHDASLDRTTDCSGPVVAMTFEAIQRRCKIDRLGTVGSETAISTPTERLPSLAQVLDFASTRGQKLNIEIKNPPTDPDVTTNSRAVVDPVISAIAARGMLGRVIIQSFWPQDLDRAEALARGRGGELRTALLTPGSLDDVGALDAAVTGYDLLEPEWPPPTGDFYLGLARATGKPLIPYTVDTEAGMRAAIADGVAGVITNDLAVADAVQPGGGGPFAPDTKPRLSLRTSFVSGSIPIDGRRRRCARRNIRLEVRGPDAIGLRAVEYSIRSSGRQPGELGRRTVRPYSLTIPKDRLRPRRVHVITARVLLPGTAETRLTRNVRVCARARRRGR